MINKYEVTEETIEEIGDLYAEGYIKDGRDIDDGLLDEVINSREE